MNKTKTLPSYQINWETREKEARTLTINNYWQVNNGKEVMIHASSGEGVIYLNKKGKVTFWPGHGEDQLPDFGPHIKAILKLAKEKATQ